MMNMLNLTPQMFSFKDNLTGWLKGTYDTLHTHGYLRQADGELPAHVQRELQEMHYVPNTSEVREFSRKLHEVHWRDLRVICVNDRKGSSDPTKGSSYAAWLLHEVHPVLAGYALGLVGNHNATLEDFNGSITFFGPIPHLDESFGSYVIGYQSGHSYPRSPNDPYHEPVQLGLYIKTDLDPNLDSAEVLQVLHNEITEGGIAVFHSRTTPNAQKPFVDQVSAELKGRFELLEARTDPLFDAPESGSATLILRKKPGSSAQFQTPPPSAAREKASASALSLDPTVEKGFLKAFNNKFSREDINLLSSNDLTKATQDLQYLGMENQKKWTEAMFRLFAVENIHNSKHVQSLARELRRDIASRLTMQVVKLLTEKLGEDPQYHAVLGLVLYSVATLHSNSHVQAFAKQRLIALAT